MAARYAWRPEAEGRAISTQQRQQNIFTGKKQEKRENMETCQLLTWRTGSKEMPWADIRPPFHQVYLRDSQCFHTWLFPAGSAIFDPLLTGQILCRRVDWRTLKNRLFLVAHQPNPCFLCSQTNSELVDIWTSSFWTVFSTLKMPKSLLCCSCFCESIFEKTCDVSWVSDLSPKHQNSQLY